MRAEICMGTTQGGCRGAQDSQARRSPCRDGCRSGPAQCSTGSSRPSRRDCLSSCDALEHAQDMRASEAHRRPLHRVISEDLHKEKSLA
jgi:hypothetical protein